MLYGAVNVASLLHGIIKVSAKLNSRFTKSKSPLMTKNQFYIILSLESRTAKKFIYHEIVFALSHNSYKCGNRAAFEISFLCKPSALDYKMVRALYVFFDFLICNSN